MLDVLDAADLTTVQFKTDGFAYLLTYKSIQNFRLNAPMYIKIPQLVGPYAQSANLQMYTRAIFTF